MTTTASVTSHPPGIYHIVVAGGGPKSQRLTYGYTDEGKTYVTVLPPVVDDKKVDQEWKIEVEVGRDGADRNIISGVTEHFPIPYLTYNGAPEKPNAGNGIVVQVADVPDNKWSLKSTGTGEHKSFIQVVDSDLGIAIAPPAIHPPLLVLNENDQLEWHLEFLRLSK